MNSLPKRFVALYLHRELMLNNNQLRLLPYELGRLINLQVLGLKGNPLASEVLGIYNEPKGTHKLLAYMLDHIHRKYQSSRLSIGKSVNGLNAPKRVIVG